VRPAVFLGVTEMVFGLVVVGALATSVLVAS
jgi:hypothetical protein